MVNSRDEIIKTSKLFANHSVDCLISSGLTDYTYAEQFMQDKAAQIAAGDSNELIWFVEHEPLYTAGTSAEDKDLLTPKRFAVYHTGRGGEYTYHGPGQRIVYVMLNLNKRGKDVRMFVAALEAWIIESLAAFNVDGERREDRVGVWVRREPLSLGKEDKIAALGIRLRKWVSYHGISINVEPELEHFSGIVPCGISGHGVTSLVDLGLPVSMADLDGVLMDKFKAIFGGKLRLIDKA
ncbi:MAG: lipoyl(octanoyl) transferase LipB [Rhizobiales bacterium]|nr:lipoyl(octanoyl) transferase LipB [Hyphomicrobiales bacterium]NRB13677.1 lipoyl(octanoyl) transferase LipB [Hyphomicrobiales bacterium]